MRDVLEDYLEEQFEYEGGSVDFSYPKIEIKMQKGEVVQGSFQVFGTKQDIIEGYLYTTNHRMTCDVDRFEGEQIDITYEFNSAGMEEGETVRGEFCFVTNKGEFYLSFFVTVSYVVMESSLGNIKNLFHFANLARTNWIEAVSLFYTKSFPLLLQGNDNQFYSTYLGLSYYPNNEQNVDEFLVAIHKKQKTEYIISTDSIQLENPQENVLEEVRITKNGWGYVSLEIEVEGDFLQIEKVRLTEEDFLGNHCNYKIHITKDHLHRGKNIGYVSFYYGDCIKTIEVTVTCLNQHKENNKIRKEKLYTFELMEKYMDFRSKKIDTNTWQKDSSLLIEHLLSLNPKNAVPRLYQAQLLITQKRYNEAKWVLEKVKKLIHPEADLENWCYYLYLTTLQRSEDEYIDEVVQEILFIYKEQKQSWRIAWLLLYLDEEYTQNSVKRWEFLERQYLNGCTSPIVFIEAVSILRHTPQLLVSLEDFPLYVLQYGSKKGLIEEELIQQMLYLLGKVKKYSDCLFRVLAQCYQISPTVEILQGICALLIKGNKVGAVYFSWYALAIEQRLKITNLYESYVLSLPENYEKVLPKPVLMYFAYHNDLTFEKKLLLFHNIYKHREVYPEMLQSYREQIRIFMIEQIKKGNINRELALLYNNLLQPDQIPQELIIKFIPLLFTHEIKVEHPKMKQVVILHSKIKGETRYPLQNGSAFVQLYGNEYKVLVQDEKEHRYGNDIEITIEKLMLPRRFARELIDKNSNHLGFDLFVCDNGVSTSVTLLNANNYKHLLYSERVHPSYKKEIRMALIQFFYDHDQIEEMDECLEYISGKDMSSTERDDFVRYLVLRGMYEKAFLLVTENGVEGVDAKTLVRLCSRLLGQMELQEDEMMLKMCFYAFKSGKYDEMMLQYLVYFYHGMTKDMRDIWKAANSFDVDTYPICERLIVQMLYTNTFVNEKSRIFECYIKGGAKENIAKAFINHSAYEYFVKQRIMDTRIFHMLLRVYHEPDQMGTVCRLAFLKYYAENRTKADEQIEFYICLFIKEFISQRIYFSFFMEFAGIVPQLSVLEDYSMIEYRTDPGTKVIIHYIMEQEGSNDSEYRKEEMKNMYGGIFVKSFLLFFGETLQYYITEETDNKQQLTESARISKSDSKSNETQSRFTLLNDVSMAITLQDYDAFEGLLEEYLYKEYMVTNLFQIK